MITYKFKRNLLIALCYIVIGILNAAIMLYFARFDFINYFVLCLLAALITSDIEENYREKIYLEESQIRRKKNRWEKRF